MTCKECHGSGHCQHCQGQGVISRMLWREGSRGREGLRCPYCSPRGSGTCGICFGKGVTAYAEPVETGAPKPARK